MATRKSKPSSRPEAGFDTMKAAFNKWEGARAPARAQARAGVPTKKEEAGLGMALGKLGLVAVGGIALWISRSKLMDLLPAGAREPAKKALSKAA